MVGVRHGARDIVRGAATVALAPLRSMLQPLGPRILLLGGQFIVPRVTEYDRRIAPQTPHSDVDDSTSHPVSNTSIRCTSLRKSCTK